MTFVGNEARPQLYKYCMRFKDFFKPNTSTKKVGNITLSFKQEGKGWDAYIKATDRDGSPAGGATFTSDDGGKTYYAIDSYTYKGYKRKGLATAVFNFAKENGLNIVPSTDLSPDGRAFQKSYFK